MEVILSYFENHYIGFLILSIAMLFALIGYFAKKKADLKQPYKLADENAIAEKELENIAKNVNKNASLQDFMKHNVSYQNSSGQSAPAVQQVTQPQPTVVPQQVVQSVTATPQQTVVQPVTQISQTVAQPVQSIQQPATPVAQIDPPQL